MMPRMFPNTIIHNIEVRQNATIPMPYTRMLLSGFTHEVETITHQQEMNAKLRKKWAS